MRLLNYQWLILMKKYCSQKIFVKRNLNLNKYDDLILLNVSEDNIQVR